jgi:hypothetical protein
VPTLAQRAVILNTVPSRLELKRKYDSSSVPESDPMDP